MSASRRGGVRAAGATVVVAAVVSCGGRSDLGTTGSRPVPDASVSGKGGGLPGAVVDASTGDSEGPGDTGSGDSVAPDAALPPIDAGRGAVDAGDCTGVPAYVVTNARNLYRFEPETGAFTLVGPLICPTPPGSFRPYSMAVHAQGAAYVLLVSSDTQNTPASLYHVDTATAACTSLVQPAPSNGLSLAGMAFVRSANGASTLYGALAPPGSQPYDTLMTPDPAQADVLARIAIPSFQTQVISAFHPIAIQDAELAGTGDGRLFAFYSLDQGTTSAVAEIDPATSNVIGNDPLSDLPLAGSTPLPGWAFLSWGGAFYLFTTNLSGAGSVVTRFDPVDRTQTSLTSFPERVVGAGVSDCAPLR